MLMGDNNVLRGGKERELKIKRKEHIQADLTDLVYSEPVNILVANQTAQ